MHRIPTPKKINFEAQSDRHGKFVIEPLYPGYGITLGNALRRALLSSIPGAAITSVKINGVSHEFSSMPYVKEDLVDILLNLKQVNLSLVGEITDDEPLTIKLDKKGEGKLTAGDFKVPSQIKIANPELLLATLTDKAAHFEAECRIGSGVGYLPTENMDIKKLEIGHMALDAIFTPIEHVAVSTEHVRVGGMTDWDKLIIELGTNGAISCEEAFNMAVDILKEQFNSLGTTDENPPSTAAENKAVPQEDKTSAAKKNDKPDADGIEAAPKKRGRPKKEAD